MELRVRGDRAVLSDGAREVDPGNLPLGADLTAALHEWARVSSALERAGNTQSEASSVVAQRGKQLAGRLAEAMGGPVSFVDPVTGVPATIVPPPPPPRRGTRWVRSLQRHQADSEQTPWATGLTVAVFIGVVVLAAVVALAEALTTETAGWIAILATLVVTAGLAPSLWLGKQLPIVRWIVFGASAGLALSWIPVLVIAF